MYTGVERIFTEKLLINCTINYKEIARKQNISNRKTEYQ